MILCSSRQLVHLIPSSKSRLALLARPANISIYPCRSSTRALRLVTAFKRLPLDEKFDEELLPGYKAGDYYPVHIGEILNRRHRVVCKLGYGTRSTVWLCRDLTNGSYSTVKIGLRGSIFDEVKINAGHEIEVCHHLEQFPWHIKDEQGDSVPKDLSHLRLVRDSFEIDNDLVSDKHLCLVYDPLGMSLDSDFDYVYDGTFPYVLLQQTLFTVLYALFCLHSCDVVHTDISPSNILSNASDPSVFRSADKAEFARPAPCKILKNRTLYRTRIIPTDGAPIITDFSAARIGKSFKFDGLIMPDAYRAPEVVMWMEWDRKVDIWAVAMTAVGLLQGGNLFSPWEAGVKGEYDNILHLRQMHDLLGPPPKAFLERSPYCEIYWDQDGDWKHPKFPEPIFTGGIEERITRVEGEQKVKFIAWLRKMLKWLPEERMDAEELLEDEWVSEPFAKLAAAETEQTEKALLTT